MSNGGSFPEGKVPWSQNDHCPASSAEVTNEWSYALTAPYAFVECTRTTCHVRFEILTMVNFSFVVFWNVTACRVVYKSTNF